MILKLHIQPGAKKNEIVGRHGDAIKIRLKARAVEGKANTALVEFLAETLNIAKSKIEIVKGLSSRQKLVSIDGDVERLLKI